ncbi:ATP-binding protein [Niveibacterium sp. SC-1]|uniref:ATP-binding protein n=1 Tax=Niveibacterium sp. SC-1 TaxID=3135646 RepID=UPI00312050C8
MAKRSARFQVSSRLAHLLSQEYSSSEKALKELVDNAWDADADSVRISLPKPMSDAPIEIVDDGTGMTEEEVRRHYLAIAADRRVARGERTVGKSRRVKGRKGVGKFAGLMAASEMRLETWARGVKSSFDLRLVDLAGVEDIEKLPIDVASEPCPRGKHGTRIVLGGLHAGFAIPDPKKFRQVLLQEYGRESGIVIHVDGKPLGVDDVDGSYQDSSFQVEGVGDVRVRFSIAENKSVSRAPGIVLKVDGKAIGKPSFFGLDERDDFPQKLLKKLYGEIDADGLREHVTAGWDSIIENSELLAKLIATVQPTLVSAFDTRYRRDIQLAQARLQRTVHERLAELPEYRREYAQRAIARVLDRFFGEAPERVEPYIFVLLEAIENADYGAVLRHIAEAERSDVAAVAEALAEFGLADMAHLVEQAKARQAFLDNLEALARDPKTLEAQMHKAIEKNLWLLGAQYSLFSSNKTLARQSEDYLEKKFTGPRASDRPDLLLNESLDGSALLIEFKRPSHPLNFDDYQQATGYRHDLHKVMNKPIEVLVIGGKRSSDFPQKDLEPSVRVLSYLDVIATARRQIEWQLRSAHF